MAATLRPLAQKFLFTKSWPQCHGYWILRGNEMVDRSTERVGWDGGERNSEWLYLGPSSARVFAPILRNVSKIFFFFETIAKRVWGKLGASCRHQRTSNAKKKKKMKIEPSVSCEFINAYELLVSRIKRMPSAAAHNILVLSSDCVYRVLHIALWGSGKRICFLSSRGTYIFRSPVFKRPPPPKTNRFR